MPRVYRARIPVPEYEIDGFGELFPSTLARFLQQVAIEASTDAGFSDAWYARAGTIWVIRRSTIEYRGMARSG
ncbi:MAG: acyl-CoA thioesterase, partial [Candidatus Binatia bacterium]